MRNHKFLVLSFVLVVSGISLLILSPLIISNAQGQMYKDQYDNIRQYDDRYNNNNPGSKDKSLSHLGIKCDNRNININNIDQDSNQIPADSTVTTAANGQNDDNDIYYDDNSKFNKNLISICINNNDNRQIINNNNNNNNNILPEEGQKCDKCFTESLSAQELKSVLDYINSLDLSLEGVCYLLAAPEEIVPNDQKLILLDDIFAFSQIDLDSREDILDCLAKLGIITL